MKHIAPMTRQQPAKAQAQTILGIILSLIFGFNPILGGIGAKFLANTKKGNNPPPEGMDDMETSA